MTVEHVIEIMLREGFDQLPVISENGQIAGVATLGSLKAKLFKGKVLPTDPVSKATYSTFEKLTLETTLGRASRILDKDHFALVVHQQKLCEYRICANNKEMYNKRWGPVSKNKGENSYAFRLKCEIQTF